MTTVEPKHKQVAPEADKTWWEVEIEYDGAKHRRRYFVPEASTPAEMKIIAKRESDGLLVTQKNMALRR